MRSFILVCFLFAPGCGDLAPSSPPTGQGAAARVVVQAAGDGSFSAVIDATSKAERVGLDLDGHAEAALDAADLTFQRHDIALGPGATLVSPTPFMGDDPWYDYDATTHVLTPKDRAHVVQTAAGGTFAVEVLSYYDDAGTAGVLTLSWRAR